MWIFTKNGFYSAVEHKDDPEMIVLRSQFKGDLEELGLTSEIAETPAADYRFRATIPRQRFKNLVCKEIAELNYPKFKPAVKDKSPLRKESYLTVFNAMFQARCDQMLYENKKEKGLIK